MAGPWWIVPVTAWSLAMLALLATLLQSLRRPAQAVAPCFTLAVLALFKQEGHVLEEWLRHYRAEGVTRFYLVENGGPDDGWRAAVRRHRDVVRVFRDRRRHAQTAIYNDVLAAHIRRDAPTWLLVCDLDEFLFATAADQTLASWLRTAVPPWVGQVSVRWTMFGSAGHLTQPAEGVVAGFRRRAAYPLREHGEVKSIVRPEAVQRLAIHEHELRGPGLWSAMRFVHTDEASLAAMPLRLNHYAIQSRQWFLDVKARRGAADNPAAETVRNEDYFRAYDLNDVADDGLHRRRIRPPNLEVPTG